MENSENWDRLAGITRMTRRDQENLLRAHEAFIEAETKQRNYFLDNLDRWLLENADKAQTHELVTYPFASTKDGDAIVNEARWALIPRSCRYTGANVPPSWESARDRYPSLALQYAMILQYPAVRQ